MIATLAFSGLTVRVDLDHPHDLSLGPDRAGLGPRHFAAPPARFEAWHTDGFVGAIAEGGSCNCAVLTLIPHCHGTHTESVGHLTREPIDTIDLLPVGFLPALLVSVLAIEAGSCGETTGASADANDTVVTAQALSRAASQSRNARPDAPTPRALILRTRPNPDSKRRREYATHPAPFLTREAAQWLVANGIEHVVVDIPSLDRAHDGGDMAAHRVFFGLSAGSAAAADASRPRATVTELAFIDDAVRDGPGLLQLSAPRLPGDALPSRPLFYPLLASPQGDAGTAHK